MKRKIFLTFILAVALSTSVALGHGYKVKRVPAGAVAFHWVGNLTCCFGPYDLPELVGYIAFIEGVKEPFFSGDPDVGTAYFTVRLDRDTFPGFIPLPSADPGGVFASLIPPGYTWGVYYDETPDRTWPDLDSFSDGERVATFEESAFLGTTILSTGMIYNLFSSRLIWSKSFWFNGQKVDFKKLVPYGVTINNVGSQNTTAFTASAVAIGWRRR